MATKTKDGKWEFDEEDEQQIARTTEALRRRDQERRKEAADEKCAAGEHSYNKEKKCSNCGAEEPAPKPPEKPARDIRKSLM